MKAWGVTFKWQPADKPEWAWAVDSGLCYKRGWTGPLFFRTRNDAREWLRVWKKRNAIEGHIVRVEVPDP